MSSKETRSKSIAELPSLRLTEIKKQSQSPSIIDPRSPSADVMRFVDKLARVSFELFCVFFRTPLDKKAYQLPDPTLK